MLIATQPVQVTPSAPIVSQVENSEQVEDERRRRAAAEEAVRRTERERDQLRDAIYQLQVCVAKSAPLLMAYRVYETAV